MQRLRRHGRHLVCWAVVSLCATVAANRSLQGRLSATLYRWGWQAEAWIDQLRLMAHERAAEYLHAQCRADDLWRHALAQGRPFPLADGRRLELAWHEDRIRRLRQHLADRLLERGEAPPWAPGNPAADAANPHQALARQFALLQAGAVEALAACFVPAAQPRVTPDAVRRGRVLFAGCEFSVLSADLRFAVAEQVCHVTTQAGRPFVTLVRVDGKWLADQVWFD
jgi:hypothetical protein